MKDDPPEKPVRDLLQDITRQTDSPRVPRGWVSVKLVDRITFVAALVSLVLITATLFAMIWDLADTLIGFRCIGSIVVLFLAIVAFRAINGEYE